MSSGSHLSKEFFDLVKSIGESRSKQEEDKIVLNEVATLKTKMAAKDVPTKKMKEYLIRMIYVEMLGHDAEFGHIHAVKMAHSRSLVEKRVGYLSVCLTLHPDHNFMLLLINTIQNDLKSDNYLEVSMALTVVCKLVNAETIPAVLPLVIRLLEHKEGNVKKKAVMALHRFHQIDPSTINGLNSNVRKALCDSNISVMGASLNLLLDLCMAKPSQYKDLVPDFVSILKQVIEHRLPRDYDYHRMPAPWIQLKLLQILAVLGAADKTASEGMYEILHEVMKRADIGINVGYAIVYEACRTVTSIYPDPSLIEDAALSISRFITSDNHNLKYLGVTSLAAIVQIDTKYAAEHQMVVIDAMEDPDETLKRKTLDLLYSMTNPANVMVIVDKLIGYLNTTTDTFLKTELVGRINQLAEKYAPNNQWYITTMNQVFELAGELVRPEMAHNLMRLIADGVAAGIGEDGVDIRQYAVDTYIRLIQTNAVVPDILLSVVAWILGEFGHASSVMNCSEVLLLLVSLLDRQLDDPSTKAWILSAILKLAAQLTSIPSSVNDAMARYQNSMYVDLQQRAHEFQEFSKNPQIFQAVFPPESSCANVNVDSNLSFLDAYVETALNNGAKAYRPRDTFENIRPHESKAKVDKEKLGLNFTPYSNPTPIIDNFVAPVSSPGFAQPAPVATYVAEPDTGLKLAGVQRRWGPTGYVGDEKPASTPTHTNSAVAATAVQQPVPMSVPSPSTPSPAEASYLQERRNSGERREAQRKKAQEKPRELTEKEKLASSLFAGVASKPSTSAFGTATSAAAAAAIKRPSTTPVASHTTPAPVAAPAPAPAPAPKEVDLLGFMDSTPAVVTPSATTAAPKASLDLLFGDAGIAPVSTPSASPANNQSPDLFAMMSGNMNGNGNGNLNDLSVNSSAAMFEHLQVSSSPTAFNAPTPAPTPNTTGSVLLDASDPFQDLLGGGQENKVSYAPAHVPDVPTGVAAMSPTISNQLHSFSKSSETTIVSDERVHVSYVKVYHTDSTIIALVLTNKSGAALQQVSITFQFPVSLSASFSGDPPAAVRAGSSTNQHILTWPTLPARTAVTQLLALQVRDVSVATAPLVPSGSLAFSGATTSFPFQLSLDVSDFLRPSVMKTDQFGTLWKQYSEETKVSIRPTTCTSSADFMSRLTAFRAHSVQTIGQENIVAARLVAPPAAAAAFIILLHGKVTAHVDLIIRSKNAALSKEVARLVAAQLK